MRDINSATFLTALALFSPLSNTTICEPWPFSNAGDLPNGFSALALLDRDFRNCGALSERLQSTLALGFDGEVDSMKVQTYRSNRVNSFDCTGWSPATVHIRTKAARRNWVEEKLGECFNTDNLVSSQVAPKIVIGGLPFQQLRWSLSHKGYFAFMMQKKEDVHPRTYRITQDKADCEEFFKRYTEPSEDDARMSWMVKPVSGQGGIGVDLVDNFTHDLGEPFGACQIKKAGMSKGDKKGHYIVQQFIRPYLMEGRSFHIRTHFMYMFGTADVLAQAYHVKIGNVHLCSEPFSSVDDPDMFGFATKCNLNQAKSHPHFGQEGMESADLVKRFPAALRARLKRSDYLMLMKKINSSLRALAKLITSSAKRKKIHANAGEANWMMLGVDFIVDDNLHPWLLEVNTCPGATAMESTVQDPSRNPYIPMLRVIFTHYRQHLLHDSRYDEANCIAKSPVIARVYNQEPEATATSEAQEDGTPEVQGE